MAGTDRSDLDFVELLVQFGHALRDEGLAIGSGDVVTFCQATAELNPADMVDVYWAGRTTLVTRRDHIPLYNRVFRRFFLDVEEARGDERKQLLQAPAEGQSVLQVPEAEPGVPGAGDEEEVQLGLMASNAEIWRNKSFAACTPDELAALRRIMAQVRLTPPRRRTRRTQTTRQGRHIDPRRTARETMRLHGEPGDLFWRRRRLRIRPLVLILDVSGSMSDYSRNLLQFAYSALRSASRVEVFCFGTRLTRITPALDRRRPDQRCARHAPLLAGAGGPRGSAARHPLRPACSTGMAAPASATRCTSSSRSGGGGVRAGVPSSSSAPMASTAATRARSPMRWSASRD